jgi:hypothetical protein
VAGGEVQRRHLGFGGGRTARVRSEKLNIAFNLNFRSVDCFTGSNEG